MRKHDDENSIISRFLFRTFVFSLVEITEKNRDGLTEHRSYTPNKFEIFTQK